MRPSSDNGIQLICWGKPDSLTWGSVCRAQSSPTEMSSRTFVLEGRCPWATKKHNLKTADLGNVCYLFDSFFHLSCFYLSCIHSFLVQEKDNIMMMMKHNAKQDAEWRNILLFFVSSTCPHLDQGKAPKKGIFNDEYKKSRRALANWLTSRKEVIIPLFGRKIIIN